MATAPIIEHEPTTAIAPVNNAAAAIVLFDQDKFDAFYAKLKADVDATPVDLSTKKGRDAIASVAAKVRSEKASIDKDRLRLTKEWRDNTALVNGAWSTIKERMDALAVEARKPLTEWEEAEKARVAECDAIITKLSLDGVVTLDDTAETVRLRGKAVWETEIDADRFGDKFDQAVRAKEHTVDTLKTALSRLTREEEERAELERLRAAEAERATKEQAEREEREAAERAAAEAKAEEDRRAAAEKAEQERIEQARKDAAEAAQREADEKAAAVERKRNYARQIIEHIKQVGLGMIGGKTYPYAILIRELTDKIAIDDQLGDMQEEVRAIRDATLVNVQAAMERAQERAEREEREEQERLAAEEQAKRDADKAHKTAVMKAAKEAIMTCGADEETAKKIVLLIRSGDVPNVTLRF